MEKQRIGRREVLRTVGVAAGGVALTTAAMASSAHADDGHDDDDDDNERRRKLEGSWMVTVMPDGEPESIRSVLSLAGGGVAITHDIQPAGPPFTGTWAKNGGNGFRATVWSGFPDGSTAKIHIEGRVDHDGMISGTFTFTAFDPSGTPMQTFGGTFSGVRIHASD
jgi:hypothetical protein